MFFAFSVLAPGTIKSTQIVPRIVGPVLTVTLFASGAAYIWHNGTDISMTNSVVPLLSVVVGDMWYCLERCSVGSLCSGRFDSGLQVSRVIEIMFRNAHIRLPCTEMGRVVSQLYRIFS